ncbi:MAG: hypothetical protein A3G76_14220 [Acidobacteria bacterium RIFCSPLOWO2_12_FULL_65_11]|nr:MAG: hypothetical protein A3H95_02310 [Acidobacteria bacterium RIFCSPLOWO2_02_FULL_64_15]OFW30172.1 MAG: hypothetical protein A3G76_14220 [Acidobacteria bacterium RIFCSPLOWO2_12_FULL_65_11]
MIARTLVAITLAFAAVPDAAHIKAVQAWRTEHETDYRRDYVPLAGLFFLVPGPNTAGSAQSNAVVLPKRTPASIGRFVLEGQRVRFEPKAGVKVSLNKRPLDGPIDLLDDGATGGPDELTVGDVALWVHLSGERKTIRMRDPKSDVARGFAGFRWFPIEERYRVTARFIKDPAPREIQSLNQLGDLEVMTTEGVVEFTLNGETIRLRPMTTRPNRFWFIFRDGTSGKETYETARFLYADLKSDGTAVLDFNQAYNPPCAFNPFTTCPLPLPENRLTTRILAGEKAYAGH